MEGEGMRRNCKDGDSANFVCGKVFSKGNKKTAEGAYHRFWTEIQGLGREAKKEKNPEMWLSR
jgi:hypothetical protein